MIRLLRNLFLPIAAFFIIAGLAVSQWRVLLEREEIARNFHENSVVVVFKDVGLRNFDGKPRPTLEYEKDGELTEFPMLREMKLPPDGRVRLGMDPRPPIAQPFSLNSWEPSVEIVVPLLGSDSVETVYEQLWGNPKGDDVMKAGVVSLAAIVVGIAGFFLQRIIFRSVGSAFKKPY